MRNQSGWPTGLEPATFGATNLMRLVRHVPVCP
jgi:hypothetical protein